MLTTQQEQQIREVIEATNPDVFVVDLQLKRGRQSLLSVKVDTDQGISLEACAKISRRLNALLDEQDWWDFSYKLEVSSPGVGYPLKLHRQYVQNIGRDLQIALSGGRTVKGRLLAVDALRLTLVPKPATSKKPVAPVPQGEDQTLHIAFTDIQEATVYIDF